MAFKGRLALRDGLIGRYTVFVEECQLIGRGGDDNAVPSRASSRGRGSRIDGSMTVFGQGVHQL